MAFTGKTIVLITGASSGLGWETVKALMQSNLRYHIFMGCLSSKEGENGLLALQQHVPRTETTVEMIDIDVCSDVSISKCYEQVKRGPGYVDILINNAGIAVNSAHLGMREAWNKCYDVNVIGAHIMTHTFAPLLMQSSDPRLIFIASGLSSLEQMAKSYGPIPGPVPAGWPKPEVHPFQAYRASKTALNMLMLEWHWRLREDGVKTWGVSPGLLSTNLIRDFEGKPGAPTAQHPSVGGNLITSVVEGYRDQDVGRVILKDGIQLF